MYFIKKTLLFALDYFISLFFRIKIIKNFWTIVCKFDMQLGEIIIGGSLCTSILGYNNMPDFVPFANFFPLYFTFLGLHIIYTSCNFESAEYLWGRVKAQGLCFLTSILVLCIITGTMGMNNDGENHIREGAFMFWLLPFTASFLFMLRNYIDLTLNLKKQ